jgi:hypothetical protein
VVQSKVDAKECFEWEKRSFQRLVSILEKRKARWPRYWVFLLKPYKALNRGGGIFQSILNVRSFFFYPLKSRPLRKKDPVGWYESVLWRSGKTVQHGNFRLEIFAGSLMGRFARATFKKAGKRRWKYADNVKCSEPCCLFKMWSQEWAPFLSQWYCGLPIQIFNKGRNFQPNEYKEVTKGLFDS